ncbi:MAG TPA: succinylglutamate desuccinylase, partial [Candidatus Limiplasma sp.]|nr:succinylglutamate desuccinylase [Candidatus Limiplasma sp.]
TGKMLAKPSHLALIESGVVEAGTVYVIPRNNSAFTHNDSQEASPHFYHFTNAAGELRTFVYGSRATNPLDQWPDPDIYIHETSGQTLSGSETRNINRTYPGDENGTLTEKAAYAITTMIQELEIDLTIDLHEASPEYPTINATVAHEDAMTLASYGILNIQMDGIEMSLEPSPKNLHGLTHRELGDFTDTLALLMETGNASQGRLRGATNEALVLTGIDKFYTKAAELGYVYIPYDDEGVSINERVGRHLQGIIEYTAAYGELYGEQIEITGIPTYQELMSGHDLGEWLN